MAKPLRKQMLDVAYKHRKRALKSNLTRNDLKKTIGHNQSEYTWSDNTDKQVRRGVKIFDKYIREFHPEYRRVLIDDIPREVYGGFLKYREEQGYSSSTISSDMFALNKVTGLELKKSEFDLSARKIGEFTNNRGSEDAVGYEDLTGNAKRQVDVSRAFGIRRNEYKDFNDKALFRDKNGSIHLYVGPSSKGGKVRTAVCTDNMRGVIIDRYGEHLRQIDDIKDLPLKKGDWREITEGGKALERTTFAHDLAIHRIGRQYYANTLLSELEAKEVVFDDSYLNENNKTKTNIETFTTNNRSMLRTHGQFVSENLGHNRLDILKSYIR